MSSPAESSGGPGPTSIQAGRRDLAVNFLLAADLLLFAGGAIAHAGIPVPLGIGTWVEPLLVPAAIIEVSAPSVSRSPWLVR